MHRNRCEDPVDRSVLAGTMSGDQLVDPQAAISSFGIPDRPPPELDRALDATERCLARHGVRRTTMSDIAREMGVSRPTLYKQLASVAEAIALVGSRQLYMLLDQLQEMLVQSAGPQTFIDMAVGTVVFARTHPVTQRLLSYEPELVGQVVTSGQLAANIGQVTDLVAPVVQAAMDAGAVRKGDARLTAEVIVRLCGSLVLTPTLGDLDRLLRYALEPFLVPPPRPRPSR